MHLKFLFAAGAAFGVLAVSQTATAGSGVVGNTCKPLHPIGCYLTTHPDRVTKSVYFYNDQRNNCGVRIKNCKNGKCSSFSVRLSSSTNGTAWTAGKNYPKINQVYEFTFSGKHVGGGVRQDMKFNIRNFDPKTGKQKNTINSYFTASSDGC